LTADDEAAQKVPYLREELESSLQADLERLEEGRLKPELQRLIADSVGLGKTWISKKLLESSLQADLERLEEGRLKPELQRLIADSVGLGKTWIGKKLLESSLQADLERLEEGRLKPELQRWRAELAGPELLLKHLKEMLHRDGGEAIAELPNGIHSGLRREKCHGVFFYFQAPRTTGEGRRHFWRYVDARSHEIKENRYEVAQLIDVRLLPRHPRQGGQRFIPGRKPHAVQFVPARRPP